jgi:hypothetical protein
MKIENYQFPKPYYPKPHSYSVGYGFGNAGDVLERNDNEKPQKQEEGRFYDEKMTTDERVEVLKNKLKDPGYLPKYKEIMTTFEKAESTIDLFRFCYEKDSSIFEFLNEEFIDSFSDYLSQRVRELNASEDEPIIVLEVGAGNGRLSHFLRQKLDFKLPGKVEVVAIDSGQWDIKTTFPVETLEHVEALRKYQPDIVIFSWMPYEEDVTDDFRATQSVNEYILIGETDGGCCGDEWRTWGLRPYNFDEEEQQEEVIPYVADGFEREDLNEISKTQICRTDFGGSYHHSSTVSFRRS